MLSSTTKLTHPLRRLSEYNKAHDIAPEISVEAEVKLDKYALSYWCVSGSRWKIEKGIYGVIVGDGAEG
jgi:beta-glucosidase